MIPVSASSTWPPGIESGPSREAGAAKIDENISPFTPLEDNTRTAGRQEPRHIGDVVRPYAAALIAAGCDTAIRRKIEQISSGLRGDLRLSCLEEIARLIARYEATTGEPWLTNDEFDYLIGNVRVGHE